MDEITVLAAVRPDAPDFPAADRRAARHSLLAAIAGEAAGASQPADQQAGQPDWAQTACHVPPARRPGRSWATRNAWTPRRIGVTSAVLAALAGAAAVLLVALPSGRNGTGGEPTGPGGGPTAPEAQPATAAAVFLRAARYAAAAPELTPGPRQFVYTEQLVKGNVVDTGTGLKTQSPYLVRTWLSANGKWGGLTLSRYLHGTWGRGGMPIPVCAIPDPGNPNWAGNCPQPPGYAASLSDTVSGMLAQVLKWGGPNGPTAYRVLDGMSNAESWPSGYLIPNRSYALMFRAAATIRGIHVVRDVTDIAGRRGIAVAACVPTEIQKGSMPGFHGCPQLRELIFDAKTYEFIGVDQVILHGSRKPGNITGSALLRIAVVNKAGQLP